jgi:head-tail adaptor
MTGGRRDTLITIQRGTPTTDDYGGETVVWATHATEWAEVFYGKGDERRQAAMEQGQQAAVFQCLSNTSTRSVSIEDRIVQGGSNWNIVGIAPDTPKRGEIEFATVRAL